MVKRIELDGRIHEFPDDFTDDEIAASLAQEPQGRNVEEVEDAGRSFVTGAQRGLAGLAGMQRDISDLGEAGIRSGLSALGVKEAPRIARGLGDASRFATSLVPGFALTRGPSSAQYNEQIQRTFGQQHTPQTRAGRYARTIGEFLPNAAAPGGIATRVARAVIPGFASEAAGQKTEGTPFEAAARIAAGIGGGLGTEIGVAANLSRFARNTPRANVQRLERRFGPLTRGERSGNMRARLEEDDLRRGIGSDRAQAMMQAFDARRGQAIRDNVMRVASRGRAPISEDIGAAGTILADEMRTARDGLRQAAREQYDEAFELAKNESIAPSDELKARVADTAEEFGFEVPAPARAAFDTLHGRIAKGGATQANVERTRQSLNRLLTTAMNGRDDATEFVVDTLINTLDDWQAGLVRNPEARRAMQEARGMYREAMQLFAPRARTDLATGHTGRVDAGGRAIGRLLDTDVTGEQVIDSILGGAKPSQATLGAVRRIKQLGTQTIIYRNRNAPSGARVPGRQALGRTMGGARFDADAAGFPGVPQWNMAPGVHLPTNELQALREGMFHRMLRPLDDYLRRVEATGSERGGMLPAQTLLRQIDNMLTSGREVAGVLFTPRELADLRDVRSFIAQMVPPPGISASGTPSGLWRMVSGAFDRLLGIVPVAGPWLRGLNELATQAGSVQTARRAIRPIGPERPPSRPSAAVAPTSVVSGTRDRRKQQQEINIDLEGNVIR